MVAVVMADGEKASGPLQESPEHADCNLPLCLNTRGKPL